MSKFWENISSDAGEALARHPRTPSTHTRASLFGPSAIDISRAKFKCCEIDLQIILITDGYDKFVGLKALDSNFKPILALGGWANSAAHYSAVRKNNRLCK